jgi:hypothetical protein
MYLIKDCNLKHARNSWNSTIKNNPVKNGPLQTPHQRRYADGK